MKSDTRELQHHEGRHALKQKRKEKQFCLLSLSSKGHQKAGRTANLYKLKL